MNKKKVIYIILIVIIVIGASIGIYYFIPKNIDIDLFPPRTRNSNIIIEVNGNVVYENAFIRNESSPVKDPDNEWIQTSISGFSIKVKATEKEYGLEKIKTYNILFGNHIEISIFNEITIDQELERPQYE